MKEVIAKAKVLSNNEYALLVTERGGSYSALRGMAVTRWQPDDAHEQLGIILYLRDLDSGDYWSTLDAALQFEAARVRQKVEAQDITLTADIGVLTARNAEVRRIRISNSGKTPRVLELTTYTELCLNALAADAAHPAFSKLFVQTGYDAQRRALLAWRRLRSPDDRPLWAGQRLLKADNLEFETDRARFIGRTRSLRNPVALIANHRLDGATGAVLDPIFSLRTRVELAAGESRELILVQAATDTRAELDEILAAEITDDYAGSNEPGALGLPPSWSLHIAAPSDTPGPGVQIGRPEPLPPARDTYGSFNEDGSEYVLEVGPHLAPTPQPWINVVANEQCGFLISESGAGYTWAANSRENRLTAWSNDPVIDPCTEVLMLRDTATGRQWSLLPAPLPATANYRVRHGFGYSAFELEHAGLEQQTTLFVARAHPVKLARVRIRNTGTERRTLSVSWNAQLVLGHAFPETRAFIECTADGNVIRAYNRARGEFSQRAAFAAAIANAATRAKADAKGKVALETEAELAPGAVLDAVFLLGEGDDDAHAQQCLQEFKDVKHADRALEEVKRFWRDLLGRTQLKTGVHALDTMFNGWLAHQNLACRMWGRSAFYQSGGAFGFRDQLQDSSALLYLDPQITREQILLHAAHQFPEGDVLHWWHPPADKGIRTRFSDDLLWLPYITHFYIASTGDDAVLDEPVGFVTAEPLADGEDEKFVFAKRADFTASLYEHCCLSIDRSLTRGARGLPLMGVGDWNDGMNRVGREGRGESVWLGFFLFDILNSWIPLCEARGDRARAKHYRQYRDHLLDALNAAGWDGSWYRRAYYDNGAPLGSAESDECRIDALAQSWAVISRAAPPKRARQALTAMQEQLVDTQNGLIRLLTPAFDKTPHDPGYIKGYVPGVRENGGQYTHAALWAVRALAEHGENELAARLLEMLSPVTRAGDAGRYRGEPYVIAADVYGEPPHVGRAGWTWYTGSAGWMYRVLLESILGFQLVRGQEVQLRPCLPASWPGYTLRWRLPDGTEYTFEVERTDGASTTSHGSVRDGAVVIPLERDGGTHTVRVRAGAGVQPRYQPRMSDSPLLRTTSAKK